VVGGYLRGEKGEGGRGKSYGKGMQSLTIRVIWVETKSNRLAMITSITGLSFILRIQVLIKEKRHQLSSKIHNKGARARVLAA